MCSSRLLSLRRKREYRDLPVFDPVNGLMILPSIDDSRPAKIVKMLDNDSNHDNTVLYALYIRSFSKFGAVPVDIEHCYYIYNQVILGLYTLLDRMQWPNGNMSVLIQSNVLKLQFTIQMKATTIDAVDCATLCLTELYIPPSLWGRGFGQKIVDCLMRISHLNSFEFYVPNATPVTRAVVSKVFHNLMLVLGQNDPTFWQRCMIVGDMDSHSQHYTEMRVQLEDPILIQSDKLPTGKFDPLECIRIKEFMRHLSRVSKQFNGIVEFVAIDENEDRGVVVSTSIH